MDLERNPMEGMTKQMKGVEMADRWIFCELLVGECLIERELAGVIADAGYVDR